MAAPMLEAPPRPLGMTMQRGWRFRICTLCARNILLNWGKHPDATQQMTAIVTVKGAHPSQCHRAWRSGRAGRPLTLPRTPR